MNLRQALAVWLRRQAHKLDPKPTPFPLSDDDRRFVEGLQFAAIVQHAAHEGCGRAHTAMLKADDFDRLLVLAGRP
jgi:hypothetical protein